MLKIYFTLLLCAYLYIFGIMLNWNNTWMNHETAVTTTQVLEHASAKERFCQAFNFTLMEGVYEGRQGSRPRPLSYIFLTANIIFRNWLFQYMPPHPSLSITWIFALFLSPYFLYKLILNLMNDKKIALMTTIVYLCLPGTLIPIMMLFHPGKAFSNFFYIFCMYLASEMNKKIDIQNFKNFKRNFSILTFCIFFSFYFDEYSLFIFPLIPFLFPKIFWNRHKTFACGVFAALPVLYYLSVRKFLPWFYTSLGYPGFDLYNFLDIYGHIPRVPFFSSWINFFLLLHDNLLAGFNAYLKNNSFSVLVTQFASVKNELINADNIRLGLSVLNDKNVSSWQILHNIFVFAAGLFLMVFLFKPRKDEEGRLIQKGFGKFFIALIAYTVFFSVLHVTSNILSGCGWYGCSFSILFAILVGYWFKSIEKIASWGKWIALCLVVTLTTSSLWNTKLINYAWLGIKYRSSYWQLDLWLNKLPRYELYKKFSDIPRDKTNFKIADEAWKNRKDSTAVQEILKKAPRDVQKYLTAELPFIP